MKNKVKKIFLMILLCNIVVLIVPFYTHAAQKGWVKVGKHIGIGYSLLM